MAGLLVDAVEPGSIADEMEIAAGDRLLAIDGHELRDLIDYSYYSSASDDLVLLEVEKPDGEVWEVEVERAPGEPLGLSFEAPKPARCANNCIFCFVHQLPRGLRKPLYIKDEDYRLSFLNGNYVTLANLKPAQLRRIIEQRLSPLYISVHATDPHVREYLLGTSGIPPILDQLRALAAGRIRMHTQVVLCPGVNDGPHLEQTVSDLASLYPAVQSLAVVPLGLTSHRQRLPQLAPVDGEYARRCIGTWEKRARQLARQLGEPFLFLADEFYLKAGLAFPPLRAYGDLPQIENGVGMVPLFMKEAAAALRSARPMPPFRATVVTGISAVGFVGDFLRRLHEKSGVEVMAVAVENRLFGESVTVSGLVAGNDIVAALAGHDPGRALFIPDVMLKEGEGLFLDNMTLNTLEQRAGVAVHVFDSTPGGFLRTLRGI